MSPPDFQPDSDKSLLSAAECQLKTRLKGSITPMSWLLGNSAIKEAGGGKKNKKEKIKRQYMHIYLHICIIRQPSLMDSSPPRTHTDGITDANNDKTCVDNNRTRMRSFSQSKLEKVLL